jgi:uncharacterized protein YbjT (DUF2867 family)
MRIAVAGGTGTVGRYVVQSARDSGHDVVVLSPALGVDTFTGEGLAEALKGVNWIIDTTSPGTIEEAPATEFFVNSTTNLQRLGVDAGVTLLVVLSIVGIERVPSGYYAAKLAQERAALGGNVPASIMRATQFHEFPAQMLRWNSQGAEAHIPDYRVQTVAARNVGHALIEVAGSGRLGRVPDVCGPDQADLASLAPQFARSVILLSWPCSESA